MTPIVQISTAKKAKRPTLSAAADVQARITQTIPLVRRIAWHVHARVASAIEVEDLAQIGMIALVEAARCYEDRGHAFATYASLRIRGAMIDHLRKEARIARSAIKHRRDVEATRAKLEQRLRRQPCDTEMAAEMGLPLAAYQDVAAAIQPLRDTALDDAYSDHLMVFADTAELPDAALARAQLATQLHRAIDQLTQREQTILQLYFVDELNLDEIGVVLGVGPARVCQIKKAALTKLRSLMPEGADD